MNTTPILEGKPFLFSAVAPFILSEIFVICISVLPEEFRNISLKCSTFFKFYTFDHK
jgi:hypothetical protein